MKHWDATRKTTTKVLGSVENSNICQITMQIVALVISRRGMIQDNYFLY
jgi:hypothetical protein